MSVLKRIARLRVFLGFVGAAIAFVFATPTWSSWWAGLAVAATGETVRVWAAGHLEKGREITRSGPYRFLRHPLYVGSALLGSGFALASCSSVVAVITVIYLGVTLGAAIRTEELWLDQKFDGAYSEYRAGRAEPIARPFSWPRVAANHETRAVLGLLAAFALLALRIR